MFGFQGLRAEQLTRSDVVAGFQTVVARADRLTGSRETHVAGGEAEDRGRSKETASIAAAGAEEADRSSSDDCVAPSTDKETNASEPVIRTSGHATLHGALLGILEFAQDTPKPADAPIIKVALGARE